jgi:hypothetical protein
MRGEKIIEFDMAITSITDYGIAMDAILSKKENDPTARSPL